MLGPIGRCAHGRFADIVTDMESTRHPSRFGVALGTAFAVFTAGVCVWMAYLAIDTWRRDFPASFSLCAAAGAAMGLAATWFNGQWARMQARGSTQRFRDGCMELRIPDAMRPAVFVTVAGGWLFILAAAFVIVAVATDTPHLSRGVRALGVVTLVALWIGLIVWAVFATRLPSASFVVDTSGLRWRTPTWGRPWGRPGRLQWHEVARIGYRRRGLTGGAIEIRTRDGRTQSIGVWDPSIPISKPAADALASELQAVRTRALAD